MKGKILYKCSKAFHLSFTAVQARVCERSWLKLIFGNCLHFLLLRVGGKGTKRSGFQNILSKGSVTHRLKYTCCLVTPWANYLFDTEGMTDSEHTWTAWSTRLAEVLGTHTMKLYLYLCQRTPLGQDPPTLLGTVQENGRDTLLQTHRSPCLVLEVSSMQSNAGFSFLKPSKPHAKHFCFYWTLHWPNTQRCDEHNQLLCFRVNDVVFRRGF